MIYLYVFSPFFFLKKKKTKQQQQQKWSIYMWRLKWGQVLEMEAVTLTAFRVRFSQSRVESLSLADTHLSGLGFWIFIRDFGLNYSPTVGFSVWSYSVWIYSNICMMGLRREPEEPSSSHLVYHKQIRELLLRNTNPVPFYEVAHVHFSEVLNKFS